MIQFKRRNLLWLGALSVLMALVLVSGNVAADVQALLFGLFLLAMAGTFVDLNALTNRNKIMETIQSPLNRSRMSPEAREAASRADSRAHYGTSDVQLADIGLIATQSGREGMAMRKTRTISKDDDGVRPFVTLHIPPGEADRNAMVRFEIIDQTGQEVYIREMRSYLRDGEMPILADNHLPLRGNDNISGIGDWDLRVLVDGYLLGIHNFSLTVSNEERRRRLGGDDYAVTGDGESRRDFATDDDFHDDDSPPMSLEDLLRNQSNQNS